jgi:hypothetical protein
VLVAGQRHDPAPVEQVQGAGPVDEAHARDQHAMRYRARLLQQQQHEQQAVTSAVGSSPEPETATRTSELPMRTFSATVRPVMTQRLPSDQISDIGRIGHWQ